MKFDIKATEQCKLAWYAKFRDVHKRTICIRLSVSRPPIIHLENTHRLGFCLF